MIAHQVSIHPWGDLALSIILMFCICPFGQQGALQALKAVSHHTLYRPDFTIPNSLKCLCTSVVHCSKYKIAHVTGCGIFWTPIRWQLAVGGMM